MKIGSWRHAGAQALLEFALVLPILFLLVYGFLEVGRLIFVWSSIITASREAVRYGSVWGVNEVGVPRYQDCAGIYDRARRVGFGLHLQPDDVVITFDDGPGTTSFDSCDASDGSDDGVDSEVVVTSENRIVVTITSEFSPVIQYQSFRPIPLEASTARTIMGIVQLQPPP
jgi:hypothetical protein